MECPFNVFFDVPDDVDRPADVFVVVFAVVVFTAATGVGF